MRRYICLLWLLMACGSDGEPTTDENDAGSGGASASGGSAGTAGGDAGSMASGVDAGLDAVTVNTGGGGAGGMNAAGSSGGAEAQLPPTNKKDLEAWIAKGFYKTWNCESSVMNARPNGAHGRNRVCSNALASSNAGGTYAVGAASVKEIYSGDKISVYAVSVKVKEGTAANTWYWYEGSVSGVGISACAGCHSQSPKYGGHDYVYIQVK